MFTLHNVRYCISRSVLLDSDGSLLFRININSLHAGKFFKHMFWVL